MARADSLTGLTGVSPLNGRFIARIVKNRKQVYLGTFDTPEEAHAAWQEASADVEHHRRKIWVPLNHTGGPDPCRGVAVEVSKAAYHRMAYIKPEATRTPSGEPMADTEYRDWPCAACGRPVVWAHLSLEGEEFL